MRGPFWLEERKPPLKVIFLKQIGHLGHRPSKISRLAGKVIIRIRDRYARSIHPSRGHLPSLPGLPIYEDEPTQR